MDAEHPSKDGNATATITKVEFAEGKEKTSEYAGENVDQAIGDVEVIWVDPSTNDGDTGIVAVYLQTHDGEIRID